MADFTKSWTSSRVDGDSDTMNEVDDFINELYTAISERISDFIYGFATDDSEKDATLKGFFKILLKEQASDPSNESDKGILYTKDVGGVTELFYEDSDGNVKQLTTGGKLNIASDEAVLLSGNQTVNGVKTFGSIPVLPASNPTSDNEAVRKAYVDSFFPVSSSNIANGAITEAKLASSAVSQAKLKTSTGSVSKTGGSYGNLTLPGGQYGFYPQTKGSIDCVRIAGSGNLGSYTTNVFLDDSGSGLYVQQRYITSSGRDHWIFLLVAKKDYQVKNNLIKKGQIVASYQAPDHPCYGQGGDEIDIPHPFVDYDPDKHEIVLVDNDILAQLKPLVNRKQTLLTLINERCFIDDWVRPKYEPREIIEIDEYGDGRGDVIARMKTPSWAKIKIEKEEIELKRRVVEKLPDYILFKKIKLQK